MRSVELRRFGPFAALAPAELAGAAAAARCFDHPHGARLFRAGDPSAGVTVVLDGFVRLYRLAPDGTEVTTGIVGPGGLLAVAALRGRARHDAAAEALGPVRTAELPAAVVLDLACRSPGLFADLARCLAARADDTYAGAVVAAHGDLPTRMLYTLRRLTWPSGFGLTPEAVRPLAVRLSHAELARLVGAERTTVSRLLRSLGERGLVRRERGHVTGVAAASMTGRTYAPQAAGFWAPR